MNELIEFILFVFVGGLICNGWNIATRIGMVFGFWEKYWEQFTQIDLEHAAVFKYPEWLRKPISSCVICYASIYGSIIFWITYICVPYYFPIAITKVILIWIMFTLSLVYMNNFLHNKLLKK